MVEDPKLRAGLAVLTMYFFFMILDRLTSLILGANFQPYGAGVPPGFTIWGHLINGSFTLLGVWIWLRLWCITGKHRHRWILRTASSSVILLPYFLIPYLADADYLVKLGRGGLIPLHVIGNALYVFGAGILILRGTMSVKRRMFLLACLFVAFLFVHFVLYAPRFPEFAWT
ncbi:MAG: hypothetical protein QW567_01980 [Candidatus Hadarchaeales archaeon]